MKKVLMILVLVIVFLSKQVYAQTDYKLTLEKQPGIYYARIGNNFYKSRQFSIYKMNGEYVYCIEPTKQITTYDYIDQDNYLTLNLTEEEKEKIELYGYFGREYPGHDNVLYSMAAQALIWEATSDQKVSFWTLQNEKGDPIYITKEKNEILTLVDNYLKKPNIPTNITDGYLNKEIVFYDNNNTLNNYKVVETGGNDVYIENNNLHIIPRYAGTTNIKLEFNKYDDLPLVVYAGKNNDTSQKLAKLRITKEEMINIRLKTVGSRIKIYKTDDNNERIKVSGIKFYIRNIDRNTLICDTTDCVFTTDENGMVFTNNHIYGNYQIEELENQLVDGYLWNKEPQRFSVNKDSDITWYDEYGNVEEVNFINYNFYGTINIHKKGENFKIVDNNIIYEPIVLANVKFSLYDSNNQLVKEGYTNQDGNLTFDKVKKGKYYLIEENNNDDYINSNTKYEIDIIQEDQYHNIEINQDIENYLGKGNLIIKKVDSKTGIGIPNTIIGIYDKNNNLLLEKITDKDGNIIINDLKIGEYYLKEIKPNDYYEISNDQIKVTIKNQEDTNVTVKNNKILGSVSLHKKKEIMQIVANEIVYDFIPFESITFDLYQDDKIIKSYVTDAKGNIYIDDLAIGNYYFKENNLHHDYLENNNKYEFSITRDNYHKKIEFEIINYLKKGSLNFLKTDLITDEGISDTVIEIYDENDNFLLEKTTDEKGNIIIDNLSVGNYYLIEKTPNVLYQLTNQKIYFSISNDSITNTKMTNEKKEIKVPKTSRSDMRTVLLTATMLILLGFGNMFYSHEKY